MPTATELRELEDEELDTRLAEYRRELLNLRFQLATGQLDNYSRLNGGAKRNVARVLTVLRDREIALAEGRDAGPGARSTRPVRPSGRRRSRTTRSSHEDDPSTTIAEDVDEAETSTTRRCDEVDVDEATVDEDGADRDRRDDADEEDE